MFFVNQAKIVVHLKKIGAQLEGVRKVRDGFVELTLFREGDAEQAIGLWKIWAKLDRLAKIQTYHSEAFARFVKRLSTTPDGDGSLLDHSILLYGSNMSNSDMHNNDPLPAAVLGRGYGKIKGGQHLHYPQDTPHANLLLTLLDRAGVPAEKIGDSTGVFAEV